MPNKKFKELVAEVKEAKLGPVVDLTDAEKEIDEYIEKHDLHYVLDDGRFYALLHGEWLRLSWYKLRRIVPIVFREAQTYLLHQPTVMNRLAKQGRVVKSARILTVDFRRSV